MKRGSAKPSKLAAPPAETAREESPTLAARVRELQPELSWKQARQQIEEGRVSVDGQASRDPASRPGPEARIELGRSREGGGREPEIRVLHADADVVVATKPAGMMTVPFEGDEHDTLLSRLRVILRRREGSGAAAGLSPRTVQRLDKETSGVLVFARNVAAQRDLQRQLLDREFDRRYLALAHGEVREATFDTLFLADRGDGLRGSWGVRRAAHGEPPPEAKRAVTRVEPVEPLAGATLVSCRLETGRQHQIRIHLAEAGHPVVGETVYLRDYPGPWIGAPRLLLHAAALAFFHPRTGERLSFEMPAPDDFTRFAARLRRR
jgi:23S rRNA pseudouridine1911/1915/1917 synthase